jgi:hypothetical protein
MEFILKETKVRRVLFAGWLAGALGAMMAWMDRVRTEAGVQVEFACAIEIPIFGDPVPLVPCGAEALHDSAGMLPHGIHEFPLVSVGTAEEFPAILRRFEEDLWDITGSSHRPKSTFSLNLVP